MSLAAAALYLTLSSPLFLKSYDGLAGVWHACFWPDSSGLATALPGEPPVCLPTAA